MLKADLERENEMLKVSLDESNKDANRFNRQANDRWDEIVKLRGIVAQLEIDVATLRGYVGRVIQVDRASESIDP